MKTQRLEIRLTEKDKQKIVKSTEKSGLSIASFVRKCCLENKLKANPTDDFWELLEELYKLFDDLPPQKQEQLKHLILKLQEVI